MRTEEAIRSLDQFNPMRVRGKVNKIVGMVIEGHCPKAAIGSLCEIMPLNGDEPVRTEVVGIKDPSALLMPLGEMHGLGAGSRIRMLDADAHIQVGPDMLGRVIDALARPVDG
ncbi:MAG: flagellum-specific ATP synthase FliI, partial [Deltaproteobacteria bacterium]|nr:flagellum-specific ATP synthase FliI [Deltaproteobacteria bacterium]